MNSVFQILECISEHSTHKRSTRPFHFQRLLRLNWFRNCLFVILRWQSNEGNLWRKFCFLFFNKIVSTIINQQWMETRGFIQWPHRSLQLKSPDYFLRGLRNIRIFSQIDGYIYGISFLWKIKKLNNIQFVEFEVRKLVLSTVIWDTLH